MKPFLMPAAVADAIVGAVARYFGVTVAQFHRRTGHRTVQRVRMVAVWLIRHLTSMSFGEIGSYFDRDHSSMVDAAQKIDRVLRTDPYLRSSLIAIVQVLGLPLPAKLLVEVPLVEQAHAIAQGQSPAPQPHLAPPAQEPPRLLPVTPQVDEKLTKRSRRAARREAAVERAEAPVNVGGRRAS